MRAVERRECQSEPAFAVAIIAAALLGLGGCVRTERDVPIIRTDSAGIRIVQSTTGQWEEGKGWRLDGPTLSIGSVDGPPETQVRRVRAVTLLPAAGLRSRDGQEHLIYIRHQNGQYIGRGAAGYSFAGRDVAAFATAGWC
jgi:hypothetical protein